MLYIVATPIGDTQEITFKAMDILKNCDVILCESTKETSRLFKQLDIKVKKYEILNEHTTPEDKLKILELCKNLQVALVSDCGTPAFCDPGNDLINLCRQNHIKVKTILGASSLMGLLSLSSERLQQFFFRGFLPAENESRTKEWLLLKKNTQAIIIMDTPYRLKKTIEEVSQHFSSRKVLLAMNISQENEEILEGRPAFIKQNLQFDKAEFMILIYPEK